MQSIVSGALGATVLTAMHQGLKHSIPHAPRMDVLGRRAIAKMVYASGYEPPKGNTLQSLALGGDMIANTLYYSLVGAAEPRHATAVGTALGLAAGLGAVTLPGPLGLGSKPGSRSLTTAFLTVGLYTVAGAVAGLVQQRLAERRKW